MQKHVSPIIELKGRKQRRSAMIYKMLKTVMWLLILLAVSQFVIDYRTDKIIDEIEQQGINERLERLEEHMKIMKEYEETEQVSPSSFDNYLDEENFTNLDGDSSYSTTDLLYRVRKGSMEYVNDNLGEDEIEIFGSVLVSYDLPSSKYGDIDFSSFQPYMDYRAVTNKNAPAYKVCYSENAYTDENGLRRMKVSDEQFSIDGNDDYVVALGTFYKEKGTAGQRYLVVTSTGMFTVIAGDEKSDAHTDQYNMFTTHSRSSAMIEWIVDTRYLPNEVKQTGDVTEGIDMDEAIKGEIQYIYEIESLEEEN